MSVTTRTTSPAAGAADTDRSPQVGRSLLRREDARLLRGQGQYIADLVLPGMLHVAFVRSPVAHARIVSLDTSRAEALPGVKVVHEGDFVGVVAPTELAANRALAQANARYHLVFDSIREVVFQLDAAGEHARYDLRRCYHIGK